MFCFSFSDHPLSECCGGIDAVVKLFHLLIQYSPDKLAITRALLSRVIYSLHQAHAAGTSFDQRPYLRFFVGLLKQHHVPVDAPMDTQYMLLLLEVCQNTLSIETLCEFDLC